MPTTTSRAGTASEKTTRTTAFRRLPMAVSNPAIIRHASNDASLVPRATHRSTAAWRSLLVVAVAIGSLVALLPAVRAPEDPALAFLLRGMAGIRALAALAAAGLLWWRFGRPMATAVEIAAALAVAAMAGGALLVWRGAPPLPAVIAFHGGFVTLLAIALRRDERGLVARSAVRRGRLARTRP